MGCEQRDAIRTGQGKIARMKMRVGTSGTEFSRVTEEFNEMFGGHHPHVTWHWFNPFRAVAYPRGMQKVVLGYDWDVTFDPVPFPEDDNDHVVSIVGGGSVGDQELQEMERGILPTSSSLSPLTAAPGTTGDTPAALLPSSTRTTSSTRTDRVIVRHMSDPSGVVESSNSSSSEGVARRKVVPQGSERGTTPPRPPPIV
jgi:hypothetical protein